MSNLNDVKSKGTFITLRDGVERELRFTLNALAELEDKYGTVDEAFKMLDSGSFKAIRFVLWAGLSDSDETLTEMQVGKLLDTSNMEEVVQQLGKAFAKDMPDKKDEGSIPNAPNPT